MGTILIGNIKGPQGSQGPQGPQGPAGPVGPTGPGADIYNGLDQTEAGVAGLDAYQGKVLNEKKLDIANVANNLTTTSEGYALDARQGKALDDKITALNLVSATRYTLTETTGPSGNISLGSVPNDGLTAVVGAHVSGLSVMLRPWVSGTQGVWYLTAIDPNTGATINDTQLSIRYWVLKFRRT